jgi:hypothetical protein
MVPPFHQDPSTEKRFSRHQGWTVEAQLDSWACGWCGRASAHQRGSPVQETKKEPPGFTFSDQMVEVPRQGSVCPLLEPQGRCSEFYINHCCVQSVMKSYWAFVLWFCLKFQQEFNLA